MAREENNAAPLQTLEGVVTGILFANGENGYTVLKLQTEEATVTAVGTLPDAAVGERMVLSGRWTSHPSYGQQFSAETARRLMPDTGKAILQYLASGALRGIGPSLSVAIVEKFGGDALNVIANDPERLAEVRGISRNKALELSREFAKKAGMRSLMEFLAQYGLRPQLAVRLWKAYGAEARQALEDNPYILMEEYIGGRFFEADNLALKMGTDSDAPCRVEAAVLFELHHNTGNGHTFLPWDKLRDATSQLIGVDAEAAEEAMQSLAEGGYLVRDTLAGVDACYLEDLYQAETLTARRLRQLAAIPPSPWAPGMETVRELETRQGVDYSPLQEQAVVLAGRCHVMALTGGPGTGKTTAVRGILDLFDRMGLRTALAAPTGRAAKRLTELTGREAMTVHRLLGAGYSEDDTHLVFEKNEDDPLEADAVILDETSMADISLMAALLSAMKPECRLIMVGDGDQLPSVGPGNVLSDVLRSGAIPTITLTEIFRQAEDSAIIRSAHQINTGIVPQRPGGDFFFLQRGDKTAAAATITELFSQRLPQNMHIPWEQIQVLTPSRKGETGTVALNRQLQAAVNPAHPSKREVAYGKFIFREGDRVMQIRNNYDILWRKDTGEAGTGVFNGDCGRIQRVDTAAQQLEVLFDDRIVPYPFDLLSELEPAYAVTVHKAQGSEFRAVILDLTRQPPALCTRRVLYTAVTRARELLVAVGEGAVMAEMVQNDRRLKRYSGLKTRLAAGHD